MNITGNTILITGGASGIGFGLALAFKHAGNEVIVAGRSKEKLATAAASGLHTRTVDIADAKSIREFAEKVTHDFPALNVVIHNAGIMKNENLLTMKGYNTVLDETVSTNFLGPIRLTEALLAHFLKQKHSAIVTVTSGLAFVPLAMTPTYSATKAAIRVIELAPPYVATTLMGDRQANDPDAMPLDEFVNEVMILLKENPSADEIMVQRVRVLREAANQGKDKFDKFFLAMNDRLAAARAKEF